MHREFRQIFLMRSAFYFKSALLHHASTQAELSKKEEEKIAK